LVGAFQASMTVSKDKNHTAAQELGTIDKAFKANILRPEQLRVDCYPLIPILQAVNLALMDSRERAAGLQPPLVDVLILDLQGPELSVLKTMDWNLVDIEVCVLLAVVLITVL
jgi:hypothetical protein